MGQLEKYGLYVLCLVIFLILGVAIWGGEPQAGGSQALPLAGTGEGQRSAQTPVRGEPGNGPAVNPTETVLDIFAKADLPKPPAREEKGEKADKEPAEKGSDKGKSSPAPVADTQRPKYVIKAGDTLEEIAVKELKSRALVTEIKRLNPGVQDRNLKLGSELVLPSKAEVAALLPAAKKDGAREPAKDSGKAGAWRWYRLESGETYDSVSKKLFHDTAHVDAIKKLNPALDPKRIRAGTEIKVPVQ
jgi:LysM repeat protein